MRSDRLQRAMDSQLKSLDVTSSMRQALKLRMEKEQSMKSSDRISIKVMAVLIAGLIVCVTAAAGSWGAFGQMSGTMAGMDTLEQASTAINASIVAMGDTFTVSQAYYTGNMLFVSETISRAAEHRNGIWTEPWTYDPKVRMTPDTSRWLYDKRAEDGTVTRMLEPGEGCRIVYQGLGLNMELPDGTALESQYLTEHEENGVQLRCYAYVLPDDAPDLLSLRATVDMVSRYMWCDEQGEYWSGDSMWQDLGSISFRVQRSGGNRCEYSSAGSVRRHWKNGETDSLPFSASLVECRELNLCYVALALRDTPASWRDYDNSLHAENRLPHPADQVEDCALTVNGEKQLRLRGGNGYNYATGEYEIQTFFEMKDSGEYELFLLTPGTDDQSSVSGCVYDSIILHAR